MLQRLIKGLADRPWSVVLSALGITLIALLLCFDLNTFAPRFSIDPATENLLPAGDADRDVLDRARANFGDADAVVVAVTFGNVYTPEALAKIEELTERFKLLPAVHDVISLGTTPYLVAKDDVVELGSFTQQAKNYPEVVKDFPATVARNPLYRDTLASADGKVAAFALMLGNVQADESGTAGAAGTDHSEVNYNREIRAITDELVPDKEVWITGTPVVRAETTRVLTSALRFTVPAVFIIIGVLLLLAFRSLRSTLAAVLTVAMALVWTMATSILLHMPLNMVTAIVPPLVITIGLSYTIHMLSAYFFNAPGRASEEMAGITGQKGVVGAVSYAVEWAGRVFLKGEEPKQLRGAARRIWVMNRIITGLSLSAATTVTGFLALTLNPLPAIKQFAILSSIGTVYVSLLTLVFLPAMLGLIGSTNKQKPAAEKFFQNAADFLARFAVDYRGAIVFVALLLIPLDFWFATKIRAGTDFIQTFNESSQVRRDFEAINKTFNGANIITIYIETYVNDALTDPEIVRRIEDLQIWLRKQPEVGGVTSYVDQLKQINQGLNNNDPLYYSIPRDSASIKQLLIFGGSDDLKRVIDSRFRTTQLTVRINVDGSIAIGDLIHRVEQQLSQLPPPLDAKVTGSSAIATRTVTEIASGHLESIGLATLVIWVMLSIMFTSWRAGLLATLPNIVPVAVYFGALGLLHITLNPTTSLIACIVLGIAVNDTVHFLARFNADARTLADESKALKSAMRAVLRPISLATVALCLGFLVFTGSGLKSQIEFGALAAFTLAVAWIADMTLTPALGSKLRVVTLWDLVRLDLGQSPQHTIPLFNGLSARQSRVFALLSKMESFGKGERIITEGDLARDMYVIVDGTVEAWIDRHDERKVLANMSRGAVLGETGYFGQRRTANVDAVTPTRMLRFNSEDLEAMRVRYPRIAATIYRNLNRVQAERIARMTNMIQ